MALGLEVTSGVASAFISKSSGENEPNGEAPPKLALNLLIFAEPEFMTLVKAYNGKPDKTGNVPFTFNSFKFVSAGDRDPDSEGVEGMSASKLRKLAAEGNFEEFKAGMAESVPEDIKQKTYETIRKFVAK